MWGRGRAPSPNWVPQGTSASTSLRQEQLSDRDHYVHPEPVVYLTGEANEVPVYIDDIQCKALIYSGAWMSAITVSFAKQLGLHREQFGQMLNIEASGGGKVPELGYVEANLQIP